MKLLESNTVQNDNRDYGVASVILGLGSIASILFMVSISGFGLFAVSVCFSICLRILLSVKGFCCKRASSKVAAIVSIIVLYVIVCTVVAPYGLCLFNIIPALFAGSLIVLLGDRLISNKDNNKADASILHEPIEGDRTKCLKSAAFSIAHRTIVVEAESFDGILCKAGTLAKINEYGTACSDMYRMQIRDAINHYFGEMICRSEEYLGWYYSPKRLGLRLSGKLMEFMGSEHTEKAREYFDAKLIDTVSPSFDFITECENARDRILNDYRTEYDQIIAANHVEKTPYTEFRVLSLSSFDSLAALHMPLIEFEAEDSIPESNDYSKAIASLALGSIPRSRKYDAYRASIVSRIAEARQYYLDIVDSAFIPDRPAYDSRISSL